MNSLAACVQDPARAPSRPFQHLALVELAEHVVQHGNRLALRELIDHRRPFRLGDGPALLLPEFLERLAHTGWALRLANGNEETLSEGCCLTMDKFTHLPRDDRAHGDTDDRGPDCRYYLRAFVASVREWFEDRQETHAVEAEAIACKLLQDTVVRHFRFSCLEAQRGGNPARSRYVWHVNGGTIDLWMPTWMAGRSRRAWLDAHVDDPSPGRPGEERRVQAIIDAELGVPRHVRFDSEDAQPLADRRSQTPLSSLIEREIALHGLPDVIAEEKAENLHEQRPAIQALGGPTLKRLILQIFDDLHDGCYEEKRLAQAFGLSRPALSRFAGSQWQSRSSARPPDLWLNVARTLASHAAFTEAAEEAGVWQQVQRTLGMAR